MKNVSVGEFVNIMMLLYLIVNQTVAPLGTALYSNILIKGTI